MYIVKGMVVRGFICSKVKSDSLRCVLLAGLFDQLKILSSSACRAEDDQRDSRSFPLLICQSQMQCSYHALLKSNI